MTKVTEIIPDWREVFGTSVALTSFSNLLEQRIQVTEEIKRMEEEKKDLDAKITAMMTDHDAPKVLYDNRPVSLVQGSRSTLNAKKLAMAGVPAATIVRCTDITNFVYLLVGKAKER